MAAFEEEPYLLAELDEAEEIVMGADAPEWWVLVPGAPWGGQTAALGPYSSEEEAATQVARTRQYGMEAKLLRTVVNPPAPAGAGREENGGE